MNELWQSDGWLLHLSQNQYFKLLFLVLVSIAAWFLFSLLFKTNPNDKKAVSKGFLIWAFRFFILAFAGFGVLIILNIAVSDFFSTPVIVFFNEIPVSPFLVTSIVLGFYLLLSINTLLNYFVRKITHKYNFDIKLAKQIRHVLMFFLILIVLSLWIKIAGSFMADFFSQSLFEINKVNITPGVIVFSFIIIYSVAVALKLIEFLYYKKVQQKGIAKGQSKMVFQIIKYLIWLVCIVLLLDSIGVSINMLVAGSAALLVGMGFGIQGLFNDFISGLVLLFEGSIKVDDVVEVESTVVGRVVEVGVRTSKVRTRDNIIMIIPNSKLVNDVVINWSYNEPKTRFSVDVGVEYGSDVRLVEKLLIECALECEDIIYKQETVVLFVDFGESSLDFRLLFWIEDVFFVERIRSKLRFAIDEKFRQNNITIPFPQRDLHIRNGSVSGAIN